VASSVPVVAIEAPRVPDERRFYQEILRQGLAPFRSSKSAGQLQYEVLRLLATVRVKMLIIDLCVVTDYVELGPLKLGIAAFEAPRTSHKYARQGRPCRMIGRARLTTAKCSLNCSGTMRRSVLQGFPRVLSTARGDRGSFHCVFITDLIKPLSSNLCEVGPARAPEPRASWPPTPHNRLLHINRRDSARARGALLSIS
jgi:hypothetical protein